MTTLGKLLRLPRSDQRLLVTAVILLPAIKLGMTLLSYRELRSLVDRAARATRSPRNTPRASPERIAWAVERAGHCVPGATCLTQALVAKVLLERRGYSTLVRVGFTRTNGDEPLAHAWVESDGRVVLGGSELRQYTPLLLEKEC